MTTLGLSQEIPRVIAELVDTLWLPGSLTRRRCLLRCSGHPEEEPTVRKVRIGDATIDAVIEREGPWRRPQDFFPTYDEATFKQHLQVMEPEVFDPESGKMFITYRPHAAPHIYERPGSALELPFEFRAYA